MGFLKTISYEEKRLICLSFLLLIPILLDFIKVLTGSESSDYTYFVYITSFIIFFYLFRKDISGVSAGILAFVYSIFALSYLAFPSTRLFYSSDGFLLLCLYFMPIVFFVIRKITDWTNFFKIMSLFGLFAILMGLYIVFFSDVDNYSADERYFTYMEFSYAQLPFVCSLYYHSRKSKSWIFFALFLLGLVEIFALGSRAALLFTVLFVLLEELANRTKGFLGVMVFSFIVLMSIISFDSIVGWLSTISVFDDSYVLRHLVSGDFFAHGTREVIYQNCRNRIDSMGFDVSGFFGDRPFCGSVYPHNIVYEIMMQWGWILGPAIMLYFLVLIISSLYKKVNIPIVIFLVCCILGRYFFSGTYVTEGKFWIFYGCLLALTSNQIPLNKYER